MFRECNVHVCIGGIVVEATLYCKLRREKSVSITLAEVRQRIWDSRLAVDVCIAVKISGLRIKVEIRVYALVHLVHASQTRIASKASHQVHRCAVVLIKAVAEMADRKSTRLNSSHL